MTHSKSDRDTGQRVIGILANKSDTRFDSVVRSALNWSRTTGLARIRVLRHPGMLDGQALRNAPVEGFLAMRGVGEALLEQLRRCGKPAVALNVKESMVPLRRVDVDDKAVGRMAGEFFLQRGYRDIGYLAFEDPAVRDRGEGLAQAVQEGQGRIYLSTLRTDPDRMPTWTQIYHGQWIRWWLKQLPRPVAVLAFNDELGAQLLETAADMGIAVPEKLAVLGVDNREVLCEIAEPPLSSIDVDTDGLTRKALVLLLDMLQGKPVPDLTLVAPQRIVVRASTEIYAIPNDTVARGLEYIDSHLSRDITADDVAKHLDISRSTLERIFRRALGCSPAERLRQARIAAAKDLLTHTQAELPDIALRCGFAHASSFARAFKQTTGISPGEFRRLGGAPGQ